MRRKREKKKEERKKSRSTASFQATILKMATRLTSSSVMIRQITEERTKSPHQSRFTTHPEEDQTSNSVETEQYDFNADLI